MVNISAKNYNQRNELEQEQDDCRKYPGKYPKLLLAPPPPPPRTLLMAPGHLLDHLRPQLHCCNATNSCPYPTKKTIPRHRRLFGAGCTVLLARRIFPLHQRSQQPDRVRQHDDRCELQYPRWRRAEQEVTRRRSSGAAASVEGPWLIFQSSERPTDKCGIGIVYYVILLLVHALAGQGSVYSVLL